jgi:tetratricopeptide (TPR) repeat protein
VGSDERAVRLFERVARASGNQPLLAEALSLVVALPGARTDALREGVGLAQQLENGPLARAMLERALADSDALLPDDAAWVRAELASLLEQSGQLAAALELREQSAVFLSPADARTVLLGVASRAANDLGDKRFAARVYEQLLAHEAADAGRSPAGGVPRAGDSERSEIIGRRCRRGFADRARLRLSRFAALLDREQTDLTRICAKSSS